MKRQKNNQQIIGSRLKQAREAAGYQNMHEFCHQHKLSIVTYPMHESGELPMKLSEAMHYCKLFKISLQWLLLGDIILKNHST